MKVLDILCVEVPVKFELTTGYAGEDTTDCVRYDLKDYLEFHWLCGEPVPVICQEDAHEAAKSHAESYGSDTEDCGECEGCENETGCEDPQDRENVQGYAELYTDKNKPPTDYASLLPVWSDELGYWLYISNPEITKLISSELKAQSSVRELGGLKRDIVNLANRLK